MHDFNEKTYEKACCLYNVFSKSISNNTRLTSLTSRIPFPKMCRLFQLNVHFSNFERLFQKTLWEHFLLYYIVFNLICQATFHWETLAFFWKKYGSLLAEGTANTWWILLHNDRKSQHRRIKKQRRYEHLCRFTSQLYLWVIWGSYRAGRVGTRTHRTLTRLGVLLYCSYKDLIKVNLIVT